MPEEIFKWLNENQGVVSVALFIVALLGGWISGIFTSLRRRPKFNISHIEGPTFCCTFHTGEKHNGNDVHRTAIAIYLKISNVGSASSSIDEVHVGYHWHLRPFSIDWLKYSVGWFWLNQQTVCLSDFQVKIGENIKVYPFLTQRGILRDNQAETYLEVGRSANGMVYFEQSDSYGGCFPSCIDGMTKIKVRVVDAFGKRHVALLRIPMVSPEEALKYNPSFAQTLSELHGKERPF